MPLPNDNFIKTKDVRKLLRNKFVVFIGDSVIRGMYKDLVTLLHGDNMLSDMDLKNKGEMSFRNDELVEGGVLLKEGMSNGIGYREIRNFKVDFYMVRFYFVTVCYGHYMETILDDFAKFPPDVLIMNSSLWDITRWGATSVQLFECNLVRLFQRLKELLKPDCLFIWATTLFVSSDMYGGLMVPTIEHKRDSVRLDIIQANWFARELCKREFLYDVFDLNCVMRPWQHTEMIKDGIHWTPRGHRIISTYLLTYIADSVCCIIEPNFCHTKILPAVIPRAPFPGEPGGGPKLPRPPRR